MARITLNAPLNNSQPLNTGNSIELGDQPKKIVDALNTMFAELYAGSGSGGVSIGAPITGGTDKRILFDDGGVVGESAGLNYTKASGNLASTLYNGNTFTTGTYTLTGAAGKTFTFSNTLTLAGTDASTLNIGGGGTLGTAATQNTGTSGANVPLLNGANAFSGQTSFQFGSSSTLLLDAANVLALRNGTTAQRLKIFNTFTDSSNGEWFDIDWASTANTVIIGTNKNGTGVARGLQIEIGGSTVATFGASTAAFAGAVSAAGVLTGTGSIENPLYLRSGASGGPILSTAGSGANATSLDVASTGTTTGKAIRIYGTNNASFGAQTNYQRLILDDNLTTANMCTVAADNGGTGVAAGLQFGVAKTTGGGVTIVGSFDTTGLFNVLGTGLKIVSGSSLTLGNAATTGLAAGVLAATTNATIVLTDSTGQAYRIPCII